MTRRDFELIARTIKALNVAPAARGRIAQDFCRNLAGTNAGFKPERFLEACGVSSATEAA